jgi:hypothetical protein
LGHVRQNRLARKSEPTSRITKIRSVSASLWIAPVRSCKIRAALRRSKNRRADLFHPTVATWQQVERSCTTVRSDFAYSPTASQPCGWPHRTGGGAPPTAPIGTHRLRPRRSRVRQTWSFDRPQFTLGRKVPLGDALIVAAHQRRGSGVTCEGASSSRHGHIARLRPARPALGPRSLASRVCCSPSRSPPDRNVG